MQSLDEIFEQLKLKTGIDNVPKTDEERIKFLCDTFNAQTVQSTDGYNCSKCNNKQMIAYARKTERYWEEVHVICECDEIRKKRNEMMARLEKSGLKDVFRTKTFNSYDASQDWQRYLKGKAMEYANNPDGAWFFIGGQSGCGKSHLCTAISGTFIKRGKSVQYMLWMDDSRRIKSSSFDGEQLEFIEQFKKADVLYIDDLFKGGNDANNNPLPPTAADIKIAMEIINYRTLDPNLLTIISSEWNIHDIVGFDQALGGRIAERTFDKGHGINIKKDIAKNYRLRNIVSI